MELEEWFKLKKYPHIGLPLTIKDYQWVRDYVVDPKTVAKHSFIPLIHKCIVKRKYRTDKIEVQKTECGKKKRCIGKSKIRDIYFSAHLDSLIFSYYNQLICNAYENYISGQTFNNAVAAYRKISNGTSGQGNKCSIDIAKDVFSFIQSHRTQKLSVIVADVTSFFDNLNHRTLKRHWTVIIGRTTLPADHYNIYKALTRIKYVQSDQLFESYGCTMIVKKGLPNNSKKTVYKRIEIANQKYFKEKEAVAFCTNEEFFKNNLGLIVTKNNNCGIPQGNALSATLANVYMLEFDKLVYDKITLLGGFYQRYSDDLIIVCDQQFEDEVLSFLKGSICELAHLEISHEKTKVYRFEPVGLKFKGVLIDELTKVPNLNKTLEYLGFLFDGEKVLIKPSGFAKFYRSMKGSFKRATSYALFSKNPDKRIFKSRLYKRFTHLGARRKLIYKHSKNTETKFMKTNRYDWGNYISYIHKADSVMLSINGSSCIKRQSRRFWRRFHVLLNFHEERISKTVQ